VTNPRTILVGIYSPFASWNIPAAHVARLRELFPQHMFLHATSERQALDLIPRAQIAFMSELRPDHFAAATSLQWVHSPAAGVGGMLFPALVDSPVVMSNSRGISADTIAEHVLAVTLVLFRKLRIAFRAQAVREWAQDAVLHPPPIRTIRNSRVLVIGLGEIGTATAKAMAALGGRVTAVRRIGSRPKPDFVEAVGTPDRLVDLLPAADVAVVAAPQTKETRGLIGGRELAAMRSDAILVNVSRGRLVNEAALAEALANGRVGGAALDVFEQEPLPKDSPLWAMPNVLITPHMAGFRPDHWDAVVELFAENLRRFETGRELLNIVNKKAGY
jgi:phosphoglycerate dehydrogenase-like enzyme